MVGLLLRWLLQATALMAVAELYNGVHVTSFGAAMWTALVIGLLNALVRPVLFVLTLPITVLTLGLFYFVVNAVVFEMASGLSRGFQVRDFGAALVGSLLYSVACVIIDYALAGLTQQRR